MAASSRVKMDAMGKPDFDLPPEPERPWPIDPRPAIRDLTTLWREGTRPRYARPRTPQDRLLGFFAVAALFVFFGLFLLRNREAITTPFPQYVSREKLSQIEKGMTQKEVRDILGEPPGKKPDCWSYNFSDEQYVNVHFGSMFKVTDVERVKKRRRDSVR